MIIAILYAILFTWLIYRNGLFGLFRAEQPGRRLLVAVFAVKLVAVPVFWFSYEKMYGGLALFDTGKFYNDVQVIFNCGLQHPWEFFKLMIGLQNENTAFSDLCLSGTVNWDNGTVKDFLYNDNRVLIRIHLLLHFFAFNSYAAHAVFSCLMSFIGCYRIFIALKGFFQEKETALLLVLCLYPALWFYTGGFLKEGLTLMLLGCLVYEMKVFFSRGLSWRSLFLLLLLLLAVFLKPYLLLLSALSFGLFFFLYYSGARRKTISFFVLTATVILLLNVASLYFKQRSLRDAALSQRHLFAGAARGGIFLIKDDRYLRLDYDTTLIKPVRDSVYTIRAGVPYTYHEDAHHLDTLYCAANKDTLSEYHLDYMNPPGRSNLEVIPGEKIWQLLPKAVVQCFTKPFFSGGFNLMNLAASVENLLLILALLFISGALILSSKKKFLPVVLLFFALSTCLLVTITSPNTGAIFRYRAPAAVFIIVTALYLLPAPTKKDQGSSG